MLALNDICGGHAARIKRGPASRVASLGMCLCSEDDCCDDHDPLFHRLHTSSQKRTLRSAVGGPIADIAVKTGRLARCAYGTLPSTRATKNRKSLEWNVCRP